MRVLYVHSLYSPDIGGGAEITVAGIVQGMRARGHEVAVVTTHGGRGLVRDTVDGIPVFRVGFKNLYWHFSYDAPPGWQRMIWHGIDSYNLPMARAVGELIDEFQPQLISCHNLAGLSCAVWAQAAGREVPVVQVLHDYYSICPKATMFRAGQVCETQCTACAGFRLPHRRTSRSVRAVVGVSQAVLDAHLRQGLFEEAALTRVIYNAIDLPSAPPPAPREDDAVVFGFIGALAPVKGIEELLEAFTGLAQRSERPLRLLVAGTGKTAYVAGLRARFESAQVRFLGQVKPADFFSKVDASIVPSVWNEPLGRVVFESMGFGVPVIGSRRGGIPELIREGVNGLLYEPREAGALTAAMEHLLLEPERLAAMQRYARQTVLPLLDPQRQVAQYEALYAEMIPVEEKLG